MEEARREAEIRCSAGGEAVLSAAEAVLRRGLSSAQEQEQAVPVAWKQRFGARRPFPRFLRELS